MYHSVGASISVYTYNILAQCKAENNMTGRAYMGEVLIQVWLESIKK